MLYSHIVLSQLCQHTNFLYEEFTPHTFELVKDKILVTKISSMESLLKVMAIGGVIATKASAKQLLQSLNIEQGYSLPIGARTLFHPTSLPDFILLPDPKVNDVKAVPTQGMAKHNTLLITMPLVAVENLHRLAGLRKFTRRDTVSMMIDVAATKAQAEHAMGDIEEMLTIMTINTTLLPESILSSEYLMVEPREPELETTR
ncbi:hypothetical protein AB6D11_18725 [Vibrio splendidus]